MKKKFVDELHWIDEDEMLDLTAIAQSSPGSIAVNAAILVGWRIGGALGIAAVILDVVCGLGSKVVKEHSALSIALMLCAFAATFFFKINVVFILLAAALVGAVKLLVIRLKEVRA